jgi:hypothetical protein
MTLTDLINKLQQLRRQEGNGNVNINIVDESEGAFKYYKVLFNNTPKQNPAMSAGRPGEVLQ